MNEVEITRNLVLSASTKPEAIEFTTLKSVTGEGRVRSSSTEDDSSSTLHGHSSSSLHGHTSVSELNH